MTKNEIGAIFGGVAVVMAITWMLSANGLGLYKTFAPQMEAARRETFEQSKAYNDGVAQELAQMQLDYARAQSQEEKGAIATLVLRRTAGYDVDQLPADLRDFVQEIKQTAGVAR